MTEEIQVRVSPSDYNRIFYNNYSSPRDFKARISNAIMRSLCDGKDPGPHDLE